MRLTGLKQHCLLWGFTVAGMMALLTAGFVASVWLGRHYSEGVPLMMEEWHLGGARVVLYGVLMLFWSPLVSWLTDRHKHAASYRGRRPLMILIVLYEVLIVQNPLAVLLAWVG